MSNYKMGSEADKVENGAYYCLFVNSKPDAGGEILDKSGAVRWRHTTHPRRFAYSLFNLIDKPEFVLTNSNGHHILRVRRTKRFFAKFEIIEDLQVMGTIEQTSILRNKYRLELPGGEIWKFRMPLFTVRFWGESTEGNQVWVLVGPTKRQWNLLIESGAENIYLVSALAFVHREWWCYS